MPKDWKCQAPPIGYIQKKQKIFKYVNKYKDTTTLQK